MQTSTTAGVPSSVSITGVGTKSKKAEPVVKKIKPKTTSLKELSGNLGNSNSKVVNKVEEPAGNTTEKNVPETKNATPFTGEDLMKVWNEFLKTIEKTNARLHSILHNHPPKLKNDSEIEIAVLATQQKEVEQGKALLLSNLRKELKNDSITLDIIVMKQEEAPRKVFTASDKFRLMAEKNPALLEMKKKFGLDLD